MTLTEQVERKLQLMLGSQQNWLSIYADWCADNDIGSESDAASPHNIDLFVRQKRARRVA